MSIEKRLEKLEKQNDIIISLLSQKFDASEKLNGELQEPVKKAPRKHQKKVVPMDFKTMYRKRGIV